MREYEGIFINEDKRYMTDAEWIQHLEHGIRELKKKIHNLEMEKGEIRLRLVKLQKLKKYYDRDKEELMESCYALKKENEELKKQIAEYDDLTEELDYRKREAKRLGWNSKEAKKIFNK